MSCIMYVLYKLMVSILCDPFQENTLVLSYLLLTTTLIMLVPHFRWKKKLLDFYLLFTFCKKLMVCFWLIADLLFEETWVHHDPYIPPPRISSYWAIQIFVISCDIWSSNKVKFCQLLRYVTIIILNYKKINYILQVCR